MLALAFATMHGPLAQAQTYPDRPIKLLVPFAGGERQAVTSTPSSAAISAGWATSSRAANIRE